MHACMPPPQSVTYSPLTSTSQNRIEVRDSCGTLCSAFHESYRETDYFLKPLVPTDDKVVLGQLQPYGGHITWQWTMYPFTFTFAGTGYGCEDGIAPLGVVVVVAAAAAAVTVVVVDAPLFLLSRCAAAAESAAAAS
jgi:hypothetical protein